MSVGSHVSRRGAFAVLVLLAAWLAGAEAATPWGWLGVRIRDLSEQEMEEISLRHGIREGFGALIVEVLPNTPAARGGLRNGDLVVALRDRPVVDTRSLQRLVAATAVSEEVVVTVLRPEGRRAVSVTVGLMPKEVVAERVAAEFGFVVQAPEARGGGSGEVPLVPMVAVVLRGSQAERAGLRSGDVIVEVNGRETRSRESLSELLADLALEQPLRLTVRRGEERVGLTLRPVPGKP